jgi:hypothetical protein
MGPDATVDERAFVTRALRELSTELGVDVFDLTPVYDSIDLELVGAFCRRSDLPPERVTVEFDYFDHTVTVDGTGSVEISSRDPSDDGGR